MPPSGFGSNTYEKKYTILTTEQWFNDLIKPFVWESVPNLASSAPAWKYLPCFYLFWGLQYAQQYVRANVSPL